MSYFVMAHQGWPLSPRASLRIADSRGHSSKDVDVDWGIISTTRLLRMDLLHEGTKCSGEIASQAP